MFSWLVMEMNDCAAISGDFLLFRYLAKRMTNA